MQWLIRGDDAMRNRSTRLLVPPDPQASPEVARAAASFQESTDGYGVTGRVVGRAWRVNAR